jgi:hypothetical protein
MDDRRKQNRSSKKATGADDEVYGEKEIMLDDLIRESDDAKSDERERRHSVAEREKALQESGIKARALAMRMQNPVALARSNDSECHLHENEVGSDDSGKSLGNEEARAQDIENSTETTETAKRKLTAHSIDNSFEASVLGSLNSRLDESRRVGNEKLMLLQQNIDLARAQLEVSKEQLSLTEKRDQQVEQREQRKYELEAQRVANDVQRVAIARERENRLRETEKARSEHEKNAQAVLLKMMELVDKLSDKMNSRQS